MSLLLEALKKAELAKQAAKEPPRATGQQPLTRDKLPDISQPLDIHSDDLSAAAPTAAPAAKLTLELAPEEPAARAASAAEPAPAARAAAFEPVYTPPSEPEERKQAQQLFEAKELDVNPRKPFYYTMGALGLFALGTIGYFWYEMQPKNVYKLPPPSAATPSAVAPAAPAPAAPVVPAAAAPAAAAPPTVASQPTAPPAAATKLETAAPPAATAPAARGTVIRRKGAPAAGSATAKQPGPAEREGKFTITPASVRADPVLEDAYGAYNAGDLARARSGYEQVLQSKPENRDALLGLAALELRSARYDTAEGYYLRLLELDPRDAQAQAGLMGLRGQIDPVAAESRVKTMIATQPEATFLYFTLGNQYAAQQRWAEAQLAYFKAYNGDPEHPDFAYNLAISLDQLHQTKQALEFYRRALALAQTRPVSFDKAQVTKRVAQLER